MCWFDSGDYRSPVCDFTVTRPKKPKKTDTRERRFYLKHRCTVQDLMDAVEQGDIPASAMVGTSGCDDPEVYWESCVTEEEHARDMRLYVREYVAWKKRREKELTKAEAVLAKNEKAERELYEKLTEKYGRH